ncbi:MAG TPA: YncE family protein [Azospirillum sp.]|nr:YncE family protein [Azospirillum sp.]
MFRSIKPALGAGGLAFVMTATPVLADTQPVRQDLTRDGVTVQLSVTQAGRTEPGPVRAIDPMAVEFKISDANTGAPLKGVALSAWIDLQKGGQEALSCSEKVRSWLGGRLAFRPEVDLNVWQLITLDREPTLSVLDPMLGLSKTKLLALVRLDGPGADWVSSPDGERLFVSVPDAGHVAVVETLRWTIEAKIKVADKPQRLALQPDGRHLWVGHEGGEVSVIDTATSAVAATLNAGASDIALSDDGRFALAAASGSRTAAVFDAARFTTLGAVPVADQAVGVAWSGLAKAFYVADRDGTITVVDPAQLGQRAVVRAGAGVERLAMVPGGRFAIALNPDRKLVQILDTASDRVIHELTLDGTPDQVAFSETYAYVRLRDSERVSMIHLGSLDPGEAPRVTSFPAGQNPPGGDAGRRIHAGILSPSPDPGSMLVANPKDGVIYYYMEGMAAPSGSFRAFRREMQAVTTIDRGLRETAPGVYTATAAPPAAGRYDVAFVLDRPRMVHCFTLDVAPPNGAQADAGPLPLRVDYLVDKRVVPPGQEVPLRFRLQGDPRKDTWRDAGDVNLLTTLTPGVWQTRLPARPVGDGTYEVSLKLPQDGLYYLYLESPSLNVRPDSLPYLVLHGRKEASP